jgi:hypothetical protein
LHISSSVIAEAFPKVSTRPPRPIRKEYLGFWCFGEGVVEEVEALAEMEMAGALAGAGVSSWA